MKQQTFEEFLSDKCECHTNNDPAGFERWLEQLDGNEYMEFAQIWGEREYLRGKEDMLEAVKRVEIKTAITKAKITNCFK